MKSSYLLLSYFLYFITDTGCGKTTVVQLISIFLRKELDTLNLHASTETSDILGGLRPVRRREATLHQMIQKAKTLSDIVAKFSVSEAITIPSLLLNYNKDSDLPSNAADTVMAFTKLCLVSEEKGLGQDKRRRLADGSAEFNDSFKPVVREIELLFQQYSSLFEWIDGPLVTSMKQGRFMLLDEVSLAEDAVLERLNSVLEPSRTLVLAEKSGGFISESGLETNNSSNDSFVVHAHEDFRIFATMNPGGDFGKRELSPALRSRFTEIWVPPVTDLVDIDLVLGKALSAELEVRSPGQKELSEILAELRKNMVDYYDWFNKTACYDSMSIGADLALSLRDILAWAKFVILVCSNNHKFNVWLAYAHGASLMHLDGLGLGTGLSQEMVKTTKNLAKDFIMEQIPLLDRHHSMLGFYDEYEKINESYLCEKNAFGVSPFFIPLGPEKIPKKLDFKLNSPTTGINLRRVLRALQLSKPVLLEGSPGVGKTR